MIIVIINEKDFEVFNHINNHNVDENTVRGINKIPHYIFGVMNIMKHITILGVQRNINHNRLSLASIVVIDNIYVNTHHVVHDIHHLQISQASIHCIKEENYFEKILMFNMLNIII